MEPGDTIGGRFRLESLIGQGGMGTVFGATDGHDGSAVAVKTIGAQSEHAVKRFLREAKMLARITHPGIVRHRAHGIAADGTFYIAMERLEGEDLEARLRTDGLTLAESVTLARSVASALAAVHAEGIVHRDIKPSNIFLELRDPARPRLLDFGVAHLSTTIHGVSRLTRTGAMVGSPGYFSPEQVRGGPLDGRADLFGLGCVLFEAIVGEPPFVGQEIMSLIARILFEPAPRIGELRGDVPRTLDELVARLLAKEPDDRPPSAEAVAGELAALGSVTGPSPERRARQAITPDEQRLISMVAAQAEPDDVGAGHTWTPDRSRELRESLAPLARRHGARLEVLPDGSVVGVVELGETLAEQAVRAARLALALRQRLEQPHVALVTGRTVVGETRRVGAVFERVVAELRRSEAGAVLVDAETASLVGSRFEVEERDGRSWLVAERITLGGTRTVLGTATPCVGRRRELALLSSAFEECVEEPTASAVLVTGPPGLGKSRLCHELIAHLRETQPSGFEALLARGDPMRAGSAYAMLVPAVRAACGIADRDRPARRRDKIRERVGRSFEGEARARVAAFLGELARVPFDADADPRLAAARSDPQVMNAQVRTAFVDWVLAECAAAPVLMVLDDLHWGDSATIQLVDAVLAAAEDAPLMVLALARPDVYETFPPLWPSRPLTRLELSKLGRKAAARLVRAVLGDRIDEAHLDEVVERADGNAFFLEELIRAAASGRRGALPDSVLGMVEARIGELETEARLLLRAASVFGEAFWDGAVEVLVGEGGPDVSGWLTTLATREVVVPRTESRFPGETEYAFRHGLVRDACYAMLTGTDRERGHLLAGEWLDEHGEEDAVVLAEHFEVGGDGARAARHWLRASQVALEANDLDGAVRYAQRGASAEPERELLGRLRLSAAEAHTWLGEPARAWDAADEAVQLLPEGSSTWCTAVADLGDASALVGRSGEIDRWAEALCLQQPSDPEARVSRVAALARLSFALVLLGRVERAQHVLQLAERDAGAAGDRPLVAAHLEHARAARAMMDRDREGAARSYEAAAEAFEQAGDARRASGARTSGAAMLIGLGAYDGAATLLTRALEQAERARSAYAQALARLNLGIATALGGDPRSGAAMQREAAAEMAAQGDARLEVSARCVLAETLIALGDADGAEREARRAREVAGDLAASRAGADAVLARILLDAGRAEEALALLRETLEGVSPEEMELRDVQLVLVQAEALHATGDLDAACEIIGRVHDDLVEQARRIEDPALRDSFLSAVRENARAMELAREWNLRE